MTHISISLGMSSVILWRENRKALYREIRGCDRSAILIGGFSHAHKGRRSSACACSKLVLFSPLLKAVSKFGSQLMTMVQFIYFMKSCLNCLTYRFR